VKTEVTIQNDSFSLSLEICCPYSLLFRILHTLFKSIYNLDPQVVEWIILYLSNRKLRIRLNNTFSDWQQVITDIPQVSILGPLLFIIYVTDIQEICHLGSDLYLYAEDSKLFRYLSGENDSIALQLDLNSLKDWFKKW